MDTIDTRTVGVLGDPKGCGHGPLHVDDLVVKISDDLGETSSSSPPATSIAIVCKDFEELKTRVDHTLTQMMDGMGHPMDREHFEKVWSLMAFGLGTQLSRLGIVEEHMSSMMRLSQDKMNAIQNMQVQAALAAASSRKNQNRAMKIDAFIHEMERLNVEMGQNQERIEMESKTVGSLRQEKTKREKARQYNAEYLGMGLVPGIGITNRMDSTLRLIDEELHMAEYRLGTLHDMAKSLQVSLFLLWEDARGVGREKGNQSRKIASDNPVLKELKQHQREYSHWSNVNHVMGKHRTHLKKIKNELDAAIHDCHLSYGWGNPRSNHGAVIDDQAWMDYQDTMLPPSPSRCHHRRMSSCSSVSSSFSASSSSTSLTFSQKGDRLLQKLDETTMALEEVVQVLASVGVETDPESMLNTELVFASSIEDNVDEGFNLDVVPLF